MAVPDTNNGLSGRKDRLTRMDPQHGQVGTGSGGYNVFLRAYQTEAAIVSEINRLSQAVEDLKNPFAMASSQRKV